MTLYGLKPVFQSLLRPVSDHLARAGVTPNRITVIAAAGSVAVGLLVALQAHTRAVFLLVPVWLIARMALNAIDGLIAKEHAQQSPFGCFLNEIGDAVSDIALYLPFALVAPGSAAVVVLVVCLALLAEFAGVIGTGMGASRRFDGPMGKSDRAAVFGALALAYGAGLGRAEWLIWPLLAVAAALVWTVAKRVRSALVEIASRRQAA
jgi:CDP-diacylglycerol--glycerol-3-phosphate 3-phosphatidyltransferase